MTTSVLPAEREVGAQITRPGVAATNDDSARNDGMPTTRSGSER
ncbi:hypothetical protein [Nocardia cyriacigeorgica]|nr:hypothetical protein [Nocardia cyriacigeorgica]